MTAKRTLTVLLALALAATAGAATLHVPTTEYPTIQSAIDAASDGDTVQIAAGTYQESKGGWRDIELMGKSLNLVGAGSGQTVVEFSGLQHGLAISAPGKTVDILLEGIRFTRRDGNQSSAGWPIIVGETGGTFASLAFRDVEVLWGEARNVHLAGGSYGTLTVEDSRFDHAGHWGFSVPRPVTETVVKDSSFSNNGWASAVHGIGLDFSYTAGSGLSNITITGGTFSNNTSKGINMLRVSDVLIKGIEANGNAGSPAGAFGVCLWEWAGTSSNLTIVGSDLSGNSLDGVLLGAETGTVISGVSVRASTLTGNGRSGLLAYRAPGWGEGVIEDVAVNYCTITGNGHGVMQAMPYAVINARNNWWGHASGPLHTTLCPATGLTNPQGQGNRVTDWVDYGGWLAGSPQIEEAAGNIIAWSAADRKFYFCADASDPAAGTEIVAGRLYMVDNQIATCRMIGLTGDQQVEVLNANPNALRIRWYLRGGNLFQAYEWSVIDGATEQGIYRRGLTYIWNGGWQVQSPAGFHGFANALSWDDDAEKWVVSYAGATHQP